MFIHLQNNWKEGGFSKEEFVYEGPSYSSPKANFFMDGKHIVGYSTAKNQFELLDRWSSALKMVNVDCHHDFFVK